jgi:Na+/proline symporter
MGGAWIAAMALSLVTYFAYWPSRWNITTPDSFLWIGFLGALFTAFLPLLTLGMLSIRRAPTSATSAAISAGWLLAICPIRMSKPWRYYGDFPAWMLYRDFFQSAAAAAIACRVVRAGTVAGIRIDRLLNQQRPDVGIRQRCGRSFGKCVWR